MAITLDITGFYYSIPVEKTDEIKTVLDVLEAARGKRAPNGGVLDYHADQAGFVDMLSVHYDDTSTPQTRQANFPAQKGRERGRYVYVDNVKLNADNAIAPAGGVKGFLTWQYYIFREGGLISTGTGTDRLIVPAGKSNEPATVGDLIDGDTVVWRLVAIFGSANTIINKMDEITAAAGTDNVPLKQAIQIVSEMGGFETE